MTNLLLSAAKFLILTPGLSLFTWSAGQPSVQGATAHSVNGSPASCTVELVRGQPALRQVSAEAKQDGLFYTFTPVAPVTVEVISAVDGVTRENGWCNGEPELCDNNVYNVATTTLVGRDQAGTEWSVNCYGESSLSTPSKVKTSDVVVQGLLIQ